MLGNLVHQYFFFTSITVGNFGFIFFDIAGEQLTELKKDLRLSTKSGYAVGTTRNLRIQWESYLLFCAFFSFSPIPTTTSILGLYGQFLSRSFKAVDSIRNYISGVFTMHQLLGIDLEINKFLLNLSLKGINRLNPHCVRQALPITSGILLEMYPFFDLHVTSDACFWCLFLFAFFLLARKSNLVLDKKSDVSGKYLLRESVRYLNNNLVVSIHWSKTLQFGERILELPLLRSNTILCPVTAYENMLRLSAVQEDKPLFSISNKMAITYSMFQAKLKDMISRVGLSSSDYSTHSFRRGGATLAFQAGVPADLIQLQGDWKSDSYKKYLNFTLSDKLHVAELMNAKIL